MFRFRGSYQCLIRWGVTVRSGMSSATSLHGADMGYCSLSCYTKHQICMEEAIDCLYRFICETCETNIVLRKCLVSIHHLIACGLHSPKTQCCCLMRTWQLGIGNAYKHEFDINQACNQLSNGFKEHLRYYFE